jgi:hypothetical protein
MKILVVLPNFEGGGAERIHVNLANEWAKSGHEVIFCALEKKRSFNQFNRPKN